MSMSKKDYIALADFIRDNNRIASHPANLGTMPIFTPEHCAELANFLRSQNSAFMPARWLGYIAGENGPSGGTRKPAQ